VELRPWLGRWRAVDVRVLYELPQCSNRDVWSNGVLYQALGCTTLVSLDNGSLDPQIQSLVPLPSQGPSHTAPYLSRLRLGGRSSNECRRRSAVAVDRSAFAVDGVGCHGRGPRLSRDSIRGLGKQIGCGLTQGLPGNGCGRIDRAWARGGNVGHTCNQPQLLEGWRMNGGAERGESLGSARRVHDMITNAHCGLRHAEQQRRCGDERTRQVVIQPQVMSTYSWGGRLSRMVAHDRTGHCHSVTMSSETISNNACTCEVVLIVVRHRETTVPNGSTCHPPASRPMGRLVVAGLRLRLVATDRGRCEGLCESCDECQCRSASGGVSFPVGRLVFLGRVIGVGVVRPQPRA